MLLLLVLAPCQSLHGQANDLSATIPPELQGKWIVNRDLKLKTISCWDEKQAQALIGTAIEYTPDSLRWKTTKVSSLGVAVSTLNAREFAEDHSGSESSIAFADLGVTAPEVKQIAIKHADVTIKDGSPGGSSELPGETVLLKSENALVFSVCNVFFEARRE